MSRLLSWSATVVGLFGLLACGESDRVVPTAPGVTGILSRTPSGQVSGMLGGADAFSANWRSTFTSAARGDTTAFGVLRRLLRLSTPSADTLGAIPLDPPRAPNAPVLFDATPTESRGGLKN